MTQAQDLAPAIVVTIAALTSACALAPDAPTTGEITDAGIRLSAERAPAEVWVELENVGRLPCPLVAVLATDPASMPTEDDRVLTSLDLGTAAEPMETYVELNGRPVDRGDGSFPDEGWITDVAPGDRVRLQIALIGIPPSGERVLLCNGPGDYAAGRYAVLRFDR